MVSLWTTRGGESILIERMEDGHLVNAIASTQRWAAREAWRTGWTQ